MEISPMEATEGDVIPERVLKRTWAVQYNPNCPKKYMVRFVGKNRGILDLFPDFATLDVIGWGNTFAEAAEDALRKLEPGYDGKETD